MEEYKEDSSRLDDAYKFTQQRQYRRASQVFDAFFHTWKGNSVVYIRIKICDDAHHHYPHINTRDI